MIDMDGFVGTAVKIGACVGVGYVIGGAIKGAKTRVQRRLAAKLLIEKIDEMLDVARRKKDVLFLQKTRAGLEQIADGSHADLQPGMVEQTLSTALDGVKKVGKTLASPFKSSKNGAVESSEEDDTEDADFEFEDEDCEEELALVEPPKVRRKAAKKKATRKS